MPRRAPTTPTETPTSPLNDLRDKIVKGTIKVWDVEDDDPALEYQKLVFLRNLVATTDPKSKLAYQICHYMEANYIEIEGMEEAFPSHRIKHKAEQKAKNRKRKEIEGQIKLAEAEAKELRSAIRGGKVKKANPEMQVHLDANQATVKDLKADLEKLENSSGYKESYPMSKPKEAKRSGALAGDWELLQEFFARKTKRKPSNGDCNLIKNTEMLCSHLGFKDAERDALMVLLIAQEDENFKGFIEALFSGRQKNAHTVIAKMIGVDRKTISDMFRSDAPLIERGILTPVTEMGYEGPRNGDDNDYDIEDIIPEMSDHLIRVLREPDLTIDSMVRQLVGEPATTHLDWNKDFAYLGKDGEEFINLLRGAKGKYAKGLNVLLYGLPGTGKTEAIKAAAKEAGLQLYVPGEKNFGREPSRRDRLLSLVLASELLSDNPNAAILADEMDDLFPSENQAQGIMGMLRGGDDENSKDKLTGASKVFMNRLLENNKTITFWAANKPEKFDPAFRRRVLFSIEFRIQPADVRAKLWTSVAAANQFNLCAQDAKGLANEFVVAPALMNNAVRHAVLSGGGLKSVRQNLSSASNLLFQNPREIQARNKVPKHYDTRFLSAAVEASDFDLATLAESIKTSGHRDFSLLLHGPAGTGKTEYLAYFAGMLDMDVMICDASELSAKISGDSEAKIFAVFAEAEATGRFLIVDEGDTFLRDRKSLLNNFEVSAVNALLTSMQDHPMPFGCTTNLYENIDGAAKRRFTFNIRFETLTNTQKILAYQHFFGREAPNNLLSFCPNLVPADFVKVISQTRFIGGRDDDQKLVRLLFLAAQARLDDEQKKLYAGRNTGFGFGQGLVLAGAVPR